MKYFGLFAFGLVLCGGASAADDWQARIWASTCYSCHGPEGRSEGGMPAIHGLSADAIVESMTQFKNGGLRGTVMDRHARGYSDEQIRRIAEALVAEGSKP